MNQFYTATDHFVLLPGLLLAFFGCAILLVDFLVLPEARHKKWLLIFVTIGEPKTAVSVIHFASSSMFAFGLPISFVATIKNDGDAVVQPRGFVTITNIFSLATSITAVRFDYCRWS